MFTPFSRPGSRLLPLTFFIIAALTAGARFLILDGDSWTWGAAGATLAAFAQGASHWPGLRQLDVSPRAWFRSVLGTLAVWSAAMSAVTTTAATVMQARSPYYRSYDWFLATSGDYHHVDTDGPRTSSPGTASPPDRPPGRWPSPSWCSSVPASWDWLWGCLRTRSLRPRSPWARP